MMDIVFPNKNEKEYIDVAEKLGTKKLCFVYPLKDFSKSEIIKTNKLSLLYGTILELKEIHKLRKPADLVMVKNSASNRKMLESRRIDLLFGLENHDKKDFLHHRNSGLNQVLSNIAHRNKVIIGFDFSTVLNAEPRQCSIILGRMMQNVRLCRKYKVEMAVASFATLPYGTRSMHDLRAFARIIGMQAGEANNAVKALLNRIQLNKKKHSPNYISDGVELTR